MKYFFDTEFYEDGERIHPISIGIVAEDGREYYAEFAEFDPNVVPAGHFVQSNVLPLLTGPGRSKSEIRKDINEFVSGTIPQFWAYYAAYDWVLFCQIWGDFDAQPEWSNFAVMDLRQLLTMHGHQQAPIIPPVGAHNALTDARWNARLYKYLTT